MRLPHIIGMLVAGSLGGWAVGGERDFAVTVHRPLPETYAAFSGVHTFGSGLRDAGFETARVRVERPSDHELVFAMPSSDPERPSRVAFAFAAVEGGATEVRAAIDVPPIRNVIDGQERVLSEARVEEKFCEAVSEMAEQIDRRASVTAASAKLTLLLDIVAISSNPAKLDALRARTRRLEAANARLGSGEERFGADFAQGDYGQGLPSLGVDEEGVEYPDD